MYGKLFALLLVLIVVLIVAWYFRFMIPGYVYTSASGKRYKFYRNLHAPGNDIARKDPFKAKTTEELLAECERTPACLGATTDGWFKKSIGKLALWPTYPPQFWDGMWVLQK